MLQLYLNTSLVSTAAGSACSNAGLHKKVMVMLRRRSNGAASGAAALFAAS
jgi:hypothetical protein